MFRRSWRGSIPRARAFLAGAGGQNQNTDVGVFVVSLTISSDVLPSRMTRSGVILAIFFARAANLSSAAFAPLRLSLHEVGNAEPLLIARLDHAQHHDL